MSFLAKLIIEGVEHTVLECSFGIGKEPDETNRPASNAKAGLIHLTIKVLERDKIFYNWAGSTTMVKDGFIVFFKDDAEAVLDKLVFKQAYCLDYNVQFQFENALIAQLTFSAHETTFGGHTHTNPWQKV